MCVHLQGSQKVLPLLELEFPVAAIPRWMLGTGPRSCMEVREQFEGVIKLDGRLLYPRGYLNDLLYFPIISYCHSLRQGLLM